MREFSFCSLFFCICTQRFFSETSGGRQPRGNWPTHIYLINGHQLGAGGDCICLRNLTEGYATNTFNTASFLTDVFQANFGHPVPLSYLSPSVLEQNFWGKWQRLFMGWMSFVSPIQQCQSTDGNCD